MKKIAFTLAEILIVITIIGIVTAITLPTLIEDYKTRTWNTSASSFERKLGEAIKVMDAQNLLMGHASTKDFVKELSNNIKIIKICEEVKECFPHKIILQNGQIIDPATLKTSTDLGHYEYNTETVGVQFLNGISAIISYNPTANISNNYSVVKFNNSKETKEVKMETNNLISVIYDTSSSETPNTLAMDIRSINASIGILGENCKEIGDFCILDIGTNYSTFDCSAEAARAGAEGYVKYCGNYNTNPQNQFSDNYWAGARKACDDIGLKLPSVDELLEIRSLKGETGIPASGIFYSSTETGNPYADIVESVNFTNSTGQTRVSKKNPTNVMCIK